MPNLQTNARLENLHARVSDIEAFEDVDYSSKPPLTKVAMSKEK